MVPETEVRLIPDERLQGNFWLSELLNSSTAVRRGIANVPGPAELANLREVLAPGLQRTRNSLGARMFISSGFRCLALNTAVGGSKNSQHLQGLAADFHCPDFGPPRLIVQHLMVRQPEIRFDQLIQEGTWVHISFSRGLPRGEVLTAHFGANGTTYSAGA